MSSKPHISASSLPIIMMIIGASLMALSIILLFSGQIWIAPILFTVSFGMMLKNSAFKKECPVEPEKKSREKHADTVEQKGTSSLEQQITFWNLPLSRILVISTIVVVAIIDAAIFRTPIVDRYNPIGSWQILMGPTLFYPMAALPLIFAIGMILHSLFTIRKITLFLNGNAVLITEKGLISLKNQIPLETVYNAHFRSNTTGLKALWIIPWSIQIWGNFASAWHYFMNEFTFGTGLVIGPVYLAHSIIYSILLVLLLFAPEYELRWQSRSYDCYLRWHGHAFLKKFKKEAIERFLNNNLKFIGEDVASPIEQKRMKYYLISGISMMVIPFISIAIPFFFNDVVRIVIFGGGIASLGIFFKDYGVKNPRVNVFGYVNYKINKNEQDINERTAQHTPLQILLYLSELLQIVGIGVILTTKWRVYPLIPFTFGTVWIDALISTIFGFFMVYLYVKKKWEIIGEKNRIAQMIGVIALTVGIFLSFTL